MERHFRHLTINTVAPGAPPLLGGAMLIDGRSPKGGHVHLLAGPTRVAMFAFARPGWGMVSCCPSPMLEGALLDGS